MSQWAPADEQPIDLLDGEPDSGPLGGPVRHYSVYGVQLHWVARVVRGVYLPDHEDHEPRGEPISRSFVQQIAVLSRTGNALRVVGRGAGCLQACRFAEVQGVVHAITATAQEQLQRHDAWQSNASFVRQAPSGSSPSTHLCNGAHALLRSCGCVK